jgi:hypothetical protein
MGMNIKNGLVLACIITSGLTACPATNNQKEALLCDGQDHFYNSEYREASTVFDKYIALYPEDPKGYWRKLVAELFLFRRGQKIDFPAITAIAETGIKKADAAARAGITPEFNRYVEASIMSVLAVFQYKHSAGWKAERNILQAVAIAEQLRYQDAEFLIGTINYEAAKSPMLYRPFMSIVGIPHDKKEGLSKIFESGVDNDSPFADDIRFVIFDIKSEKSNRMKYEEQEIQKLWSDLIQKYPRNKKLLQFAGQH